MRVIRSPSLDVYYNLALEDVLLDQATSAASTLLFWRSQASVVIGKNQNPWRECDPAIVAAEGGCVARRISGGGAVYHGAGNVNYAWFTARIRYRTEEVFDVVRGALGALGVGVERLGKSSLAVDGYKVSGTAFCFRRQAVMHHGTLLIAADLDRLRGWLRGRVPDMETRAIPSEPAPVANLADYGITQPALEASLATAFCCFAEEPITPVPAIPCGEVTSRRARMAGWDWIWGHTPRFSCCLGDSRVDVEKARIVAVSDPLHTWAIGRPFDALLEVERP